MVIVPKADKDIRICVDLTKLNRHIDRPIYPTTAPYDAVSNIKPGCKYFTKLDAKHGYWQIPIEEKSQHLTTFLTPWGRYKFLRAPMGFSATGDEYCRRGAQITDEPENTERVMDDTLIYDTNLKEHYEKVRRYLLRCRENHITLNRDKFEFAQL